MSICKECNRKFEAYQTVVDCDICKFGQIESTRDYGYDRDGMMLCWKCNGTTEIKRIEDNFCSEECSEEYLK